MPLSQQLFNPEEAFVRIGQTRQAGCLVIVSPEASFRLFAENGVVVNAFGENAEGAKALEYALCLQNACHIWFPDSKPSKKPMNVNISAYALKHSVARDIRIAETSRVQLTAAEEHPPKKNEKKSAKAYYLVAEDRLGEKLFIGKGTVILGREESCDITLNHIQVSRRHCLLQMVARGLSFRDLDSTNGVRINGFSAQDGFLNVGDQLQLGSYTLTIYANS